MRKSTIKSIVCAVSVALLVCLNETVSRPEPHVLVTTLATVKHRCTLICASQLLSIISHFFPPTIWTGLPNYGVFLNVILGEGLDRRKLGAEEGGESCGL